MPRKITIPEDCKCQELMSKVEAIQKEMYGERLSWHTTIANGLQLYINDLENKKEQGSCP